MKFFNKPIVKIIINIGLMFTTFILLIIIANYLLGVYTHHGDSLTVPDFKGKTIKEVQSICDDNNLRFKIKDSSFDPTLPKYVVMEQNPIVGSHVKENRRIYIVINGKDAPMVKLPDIIDNQMRIAIQRLASLGINWDGDEDDRQPDPALNAVLGVKFNGKTLQPNDQIPKGIAVHLILGDGLQAPKVEIPDLVDKTFEQALFTLRSSDLNIGKITNDDGEELNTAPPTYIVTEQDPSPSKDKKANLIGKGQAISIKVKKNK